MSASSPSGRLMLVRRSSWQRRGARGSNELTGEKGKAAGQSRANVLSFSSVEARSVTVQAGSAAVRPDTWRMRRRGIGRRRLPPLEADALEASLGWRSWRPQTSGAGGEVYCFQLGEDASGS